MSLLNTLKGFLKNLSTKEIIYTVCATGTFEIDGEVQKEPLLLSIDNTERSSTERWVRTKTGWQPYLHHCLTSSEGYVRRFINEEQMQRHIRPPRGAESVKIDWSTARVVKFTVNTEKDTKIDFL